MASAIKVLVGQNARVSALVGSLLAGNCGLTDIYISSDEPVMARLASSVWVPVLSSDGAMIRHDTDSLRAFVNGIFLGEETSRSVQSPAWDGLLRRMGSLHPAAVLSTEVDGVVQTFRVRCTIQRQSMGAGLGIVIRALAQQPPSVSDLGLPVALAQHVGSMTSALSWSPALLGLARAQHLRRSSSTSTGLELRTY